MSPRSRPLQLPLALVRLALVALVPACGAPIDYSKIRTPAAAREPDPPGREEERQELDPKTGRVEHEWSVFVTPGRGALKHGEERIYFPDGTLHWEREFRYGKPTGAWRSYWENGKPRTECFYLGPEVERTMTFWREDGKISAQGPACDGNRRGKWRFFWNNGQLAEEGEFRGGLREGTWSAWNRDGTRRFERTYERNVRVSQREVAVDPAKPADSAAEASAPAKSPQ